MTTNMTRREQDPAIPGARTPQRPGRGVRLIAAAVAGVALLGVAAAGCSSPQASESVIVDREAVKVSKLVDSVLEGIAFESGSEGAGFLFGLLFPEEDTITPQFEKMNTKLDAISQQLVQVEAAVAAVKTEVDIAEEDGALKDLRGFANTVRDLYDNDYLPVSTAAIALAKAKEAGTDTTAAQAQLDQAKADFVAAYKQKDIGTILLNQGDYITGGGGIKSAPKLVGRVMLDKGYVNHNDSVTLQRFYDALADQQAATQMMQLEYDLATNNGKYAANSANYQGVVADATRVPVIADGSIIVTPTGAASTVGATEFMAPDHTTADGTVDQPYREVLRLPFGGGWNPTDPVDAIIAANPGWELPSNSTMLSLTGAVKGVQGDNYAAKLSEAASPATPDDASRGDQARSRYKWQGATSTGGLWTSNLTDSTPVVCEVRQNTIFEPDTINYVTYRLHNGVSLTGTPQAHAMPIGLDKWIAGDYDEQVGTGTDNCVNKITEFLTDQDPSSGAALGLPFNPFNAKAGVALSRTTSVDYMAQG